MMVGYIKGLLSKLGLNPLLYNGHTMCIRGATTATVAGLRDWEIKSLGCWKSNTYQTYIRETTDMKINSAKRMACALGSITFNCSQPYPDKGNSDRTVLPAFHSLLFHVWFGDPVDPQHCSAGNRVLVCVTVYLVIWTCTPFHPPLGIC